MEKLKINKKEKGEMVILTKFLLKRKKVTETEYRKILDTINLHSE